MTGLHRGVAGTATGLLMAVLALGGCTAERDSPTPTTTPVPDPPALSVPPAATTPVPPPTPGSARSRVPSQRTEKRKPVGLDQQGEAADGVQVRLSSIEAIEATASGPGEVAGPALAVTVQVENVSNETVDLGSAVVNLTASDKSPGSVMSTPPAKALTGTLPAGGQASGVYVFTVAPKKRDPVTVEVAVTATSPVVLFRGQPQT